jgi:hypothetical protein
MAKLKPALATRQITHPPPARLRRDGPLIQVLRYDAHVEESQVKQIHLNAYWLPPTFLSPSATKLVENAELCDALFAALQLQMLRLDDNKSAARAISQCASQIIGFFEFMWLKGCFALEHATPALFADFAEAAAKGGWGKVLSIEERVLHFMQGRSNDQLHHYVRQAKQSGGRKSLAKSFYADLGTNCSANIIQGRKLVFARLGLPAPRSSDRDVSEKGLATSSLVSILQAVNLLADVKDGLRFCPFPQSYVLAVSLCRPNGRTQNTSPAEVGHVLVDAVRWIEEVAPLVSDAWSFVHDVHSAKVAEGGVLTQAESLQSIAQMQARPALEEYFKRPLKAISTTRAPNGLSLNVLTQSIVEACFDIIAIFNARRLDEVLHRKFGLNEASLHVVSRDLDLHECDFYVEKTAKKRMRFYVNGISARAIRVLKDLSGHARALNVVVGGQESANKEDRSLFQIPQLVVSGDSRFKPVWFSYNKTTAQMHLLPGALSVRRLKPHMMRRAYACVFMYRFEEATLLALKQKLVHFDIRMARLYFRDAARISTEPVSRLFRRRSKEEIAEHEAEIRDLQVDISEVSKERLRQLAASILDDSCKDAGQFRNLMQRVHQRLSGMIEYRELDIDRKTQTLTRTFEKRGHQFDPMWHGLCVASTEYTGRQTPCARKAGVAGVAKSEAGPEVCAGCRYHHVTAGHMPRLEERLVVLRQEADTSRGTIRGREARQSHDNLARIVTLYRGRISRGPAT